MKAYSSLKMRRSESFFCVPNIKRRKGSWQSDRLTRKTGLHRTLFFKSTLKNMVVGGFEANIRSME